MSTGSVTCLFLALLCVQVSDQIPLKEYLSLTKGQKLKLDEFRSRVIDHLPQDYMRKDIHLIRWLREKDFDVDAAVELLFKNISWRENNRMDHIFEEDWSELDNEFKFGVEGCDVDGKPVVSVRLGDWDMRKFVIAGKTKKVIRFIDKLFEEALRMVLLMQEDGQNVTQASMIVDWNNFNILQHGCGKCIPVFLHLLTTYESNYPGFIHKIVVVNTPQIAIPIWELLKGLVSPKTRDIFLIYGKIKSEWSSVLLKEINPNQLSRSFGGTKPEALDFQDLRETGEIYNCVNF